MRKYIDILNEVLTSNDNTPRDAMGMLRKVLEAWEEPCYGDNEVRLDNLSTVMDEVRAMLGIEDMAAKSLDYRRGRNDAYQGRMFDPPLGRTSNGEYKQGWEQGRREKGL